TGTFHKGRHVRVPDALRRPAEAAGGPRQSRGPASRRGAVRNAVVSVFHAASRGETGERRVLVVIDVARMSERLTTGVWCPTLTPLDAGLAPDLRLLSVHCRWLLEQGCHGIL